MRHHQVKGWIDTRLLNNGGVSSVHRSYLFNSSSKIENSRRLILVMLYLQELMPLEELLTDYEMLRQALMTLSPVYSKVFSSRREIRAELRSQIRDVKSRQNLLERGAIRILGVMSNGEIREMKSSELDASVIPMFMLIRITDEGKSLIVDDFWLEMEFSRVFREVINRYLRLMQIKVNHLVERHEAIQQSIELMQHKFNEPETREKEHVSLITSSSS